VACTDSASIRGELNSRLDTLQEQVTGAGRFVAQHSEGNRQKDCETCVEVGEFLTGLGMNGSKYSDGRLESERVAGYVTLMMQQYCVMRLT
jgi:hypothetical protein